MSSLGQGFWDAWVLILTFDADLYEIIFLSLQVTVSAVIIASVIGLPMGAWLAVNRFRLRRYVIAVLNALMGLPPVVVGLIVYMALSRAGPLGGFGLLFSPTAMIIAQVIIITPLIVSLSHQTIRDLWAEYHDLLISMNASRGQRIKALLWDGKRALLTAMLAGFGRAIGEVGAIMIVGGNIDHATRCFKPRPFRLKPARGTLLLPWGLAWF